MIARPGDTGGGFTGWGTGGDRSGLILLAGYGRGALPLARALEERGCWVLVVDRFQAALREARGLRPNAVLVGTDPSAGDHKRFLEQLSSSGLGAAILYLTRRVDAAESREATALGADDVVCPPHSAAAVLVRLGVLDNRVPAPRLPSRTISWGSLTLDLTSRQVLDGNRPLTLSGREFELLVHLLEAGGRVVSRSELLEAIWGGDQGSGAVLDATVHRLRRKLGEVVADPEVVETVRGVGYRLETPAVAEAGAPGEGAAAD